MLRRAVTLLLSLSLVAFLLGISAGLAVADTPQRGAAAQALALLNSRYREPLGLPDLSWDNRLAAAAQNHANYWAYGNPFGHEETPGARGYTGRNAADRCQAVGAPPCSEVAAATADLVGAMQQWMSSPFHGWILIASASIGCGSSSGGSDCDLAGNGSPSGAQVANTVAAANAPGSPVRIWPFNGAQQVPLIWYGGEIPDPLQNYRGNHYDVGPNMFFYVAGESASITLTDSGGRTIPLIAPMATTAVSPLVVNPPSDSTGGAWFEAFAGHHLSKASRYTLTVQTADGMVRSVRFTTLDPLSLLPACHVPRLKHMTLGQARLTLGRAHCRLGHVTRPKHLRRHHILRVVRQSVSPGAVRRSAFRVSVTLG